jgi:hypothetical protein
MILPLAAMLPFERHVRWAQRQQIPGKVAESLLNGLGPLADVLTGRYGKLPGPLGKLLRVAGPGLKTLTDMAGERLREMNSDALAKKDNLRATLTRFGMDLDRGEEERILLRSLR